MLKLHFSKFIRVSRSLLQELPYESKSIYTELDAELGIESKTKSITDESGVAIQTRLDLQFNIESSYDIPDMRM